MQNDMLKNTIVPWQEKGRWYHAHITEAGVDVNNTDDFVKNNFNIASNASNIYVKKGVTVIDIKIRINSYETSNATTITPAVVLRVDGRFQLNILNPSNFTSLDCDYYFFC